MSIVEAKEKNFLGKERDRRTDDLLELTEVLFLVLNRTRGVFFVLFCFLVVLVWTQSFMLARQAYYHFSCTPSPFIAIRYLSNTVLCFLPGTGLGL
jgi:hypothetical protein